MNKKQLENALDIMLMTVLQNDDFDLYEEMLKDFAKKEVKKTLSFWSRIKLQF